MTPALAVIALSGVALLQTGNVETHGTDPAELPKVACKAIADLASKLPGLTVKDSDGTVHDHKTDSSHNGCRIVGASDGAQYRKDEWPHDILRIRMISESWREDIGRAADGAGSTAFAIRKGTAMCLFSASWDTGEPSESGISATGEYKIEVGCFSGEEDSSRPRGSHSEAGSE
jgi:hypothetical protein